MSSPAAGRSDELISVIVPARDALHYLHRTVPALLRAAERDSAIEIVVVDNGSTDGSEAYVRSHAPRVRLISAPGVRVGAVRNAGVAQAGGEWYCFLDADCLVPEDFFVHVRVQVRERRHEVFGSRYRLPPEPRWIERVWHSLHREAIDGPVAHLPGGNLIVSRRAFEKAGGFDPELQSGEDAALCVALSSVGHRPMHVGAVGVMHLGNPRSVRAFFRQQLWHAMGMPADRRLFAERPAVAAMLFMVALIGAAAILFQRDLALATRLALSLTVAFAVPLASVVFRRPSDPVAWLAPRAVFLYSVYLTARSVAVLLLLMRALRGTAFDLSIARTRH